MKNTILLGCLALCLFSATAWSQETQISGSERSLETSSDEIAVRSAILDYVEALYLVDSTRIQKSVSPNLRKIGYWYDEKQEVYYENLEMTYEELLSLSAKWNTSGTRADEESPKVITVFEVNDKTAIAKLTAAWGIDYFQLAKTQGKWVIMNVMWQSMPK